MKSKFSTEINSKTVKQFSSQPQTSKSCEKKKYSTQPSHSSIAGPSSSNSTRNSYVHDSRSTNLQTKLPNGYKYGLILPNIYDENLCGIKQPFLAQICEFELLEFGFDIPFNDFLNDKNNNFSIEIGKQKLYAQLIAIADTPSELQECLRRNLELNSNWKNLRKIIGNVNKVMHLIHAPLSESDDFPIKHVLSNKILDSLIKDFTSNEENQIKKINSERNSSIEKRSQVKANSDKIQRQQDDEATDPVQVIERNQSDTRIEVLKMKLEALNQKKNFLLDSDILSSTLKATIEAVSSVFSLVVKEKESKIITMNVPAKDETYKIKKKNQIFIEGLIQFDLDKYQFATAKVKQKNACALAYQLVHRVFPAVYWKNVTLGKKFYDQEEIKYFSEQIKESRKMTKKVPLCFVWGFKDPFNEPYQGDLDIIRGQERVRALIDHIFRKCEKLTYVEEEEAKVRERLIKELCQKNSPDKSGKSKSSKSTDPVEFSDNQSDDGRNSEREQDDESIPGEDNDTQSAFSDIWNSELFSGTKN